MPSSLNKFLAVIFALLFALFIRLFLLAVYKIPTDSMRPTFIPGDFILASQFSYGLKFPWNQSVWFQDKPKKGDLIIFSFESKPSIPYVRRVVGVEGDEVVVLGGKIRVGPGEVYVLSDNPKSMDDSRELGLVSIERIEAKAWMIWFSISSDLKIRWQRVRWL